MSAAAALSTLFECTPQALFGLDQLGAVFGGDVGALLESGFLIETSPVRHAICFDCGEAHDLSVTPNSRGRLGSHCVDGGGWAEVRADALRRYRFDHDRFLVALAKALAVDTRAKAIVEDVCWRLGAGGGADYLALVAREMSDPSHLLAIADRLTRFKNWRGVVMCSARPSVELGLFPKALAMTAFEEVITLTAKGELVVDKLALEEALNLRRRGRGAHGASWDHPDLVPLIDVRRRSGASLVNAHAEAEWLLANPTWARRRPKTPGRATLAKFVRRRWAKLE